MIQIDDERNHVLTRITKVESDHNVIFTNFKLSWNNNFRKRGVELFNLKNKECQSKFTEATQGRNNNNVLSSVFDEKDDLDILTEKFLKRLQKTVSSCFRKIRVTKRIEKEKDELFTKWRELKKKSD